MPDTPPVCPDDFKNAVPDANGRLCDQMVKVLNILPTLVYRFFAWFMRADCQLSDEGANWICDGLSRIGCGVGGTTGGTGGTGGTTGATTGGTGTTTLTTTPACIPNVNLIQAMDGYASPQWVVEAPYGDGGSGREVWQLFDGSYAAGNYGILSLITQSCIVQGVFNGPDVEVKAFRLFRRAGNPSPQYVPFAYTVNYTLDGFNYTQLPGGIGAFDPAGWTSDYQTIVLPNSLPAKGYRFIFTAPNSTTTTPATTPTTTTLPPPPTIIEIAELQLFCAVT